MLTPNPKPTARSPLSHLSPPERISVLREKRRSLDTELERLKDRRYLNAEEQSRARRLKRQKLAAKDEIASLLRAT